MRQLVPALSLMIALVGCAESHGRSTLGDGAVPVDDAETGCAGWGPTCVQPTAHVCGDASPPAECVGGAWQCPPGWSANQSECWCYGSAPPGCECTPSGWACPVDAGMPDAGGCPSDPGAEGSPCASEGLSCSWCSDPCGFCNILECEGGVWIRLEAPPPPGPCVSFECGSSFCDATAQYCSHSISDIGGEPDSYGCVPYPAGCASCECLGGNECTGDASTGITVTWYGG